MAEAARAALLAAGALALTLAGCADEARKREAELTQLLAWLPGSYDNGAQADDDTRRGVRPAHARISLVLIKVYTPRLGHHVYYAQETAADDPRRVFSQKMYSFTLDEKRGIVETLYELVEPLRWRDGQLNKDMFTGMVMEDVQPEACQLLWKKTDSGFVATHDPKVCPDAGHGAILHQAEFEGGLLTIGEYKFHRVH